MIIIIESAIVISHDDADDEDTNPYNDSYNSNNISPTLVLDSRRRFVWGGCKRKRSRKTGQQTSRGQIK
jgi:hypothetical protein